MSFSDVRLSAVTRVERHRAIDELNIAVSDVGGWVDDVNFFSNLSVALRCMIPALGAVGLERELTEIGLRLDANELVALSQAGACGKSELLVSLNFTFVHDEPETPPDSSSRAGLTKIRSCEVAT